MFEKSDLERRGVCIIYAANLRFCFSQMQKQQVFSSRGSNKDIILNKIIMTYLPFIDLPACIIKQDKRTLATRKSKTFYVICVFVTLVISQFRFMGSVLVLIASAP